MKLVLLSFIIVFLTFSIQTAFGYKIDFTGENFYTVTFDSIDNIDEKLYRTELFGKEGTNSKIKRLSEIDCLKGDLGVDDVKKISSGNTQVLTDNIKDSCKDENGAVPNNTLQKLQTSVIQLNQNTRQQAYQKSNEATKFARIGVYSDDIEENGPFDLVEDIEKTDVIIFEKTKEYDYEGDSFVDIGGKIEADAAKVPMTNGNSKPSSQKQSALNTNNPDVILCKLGGNCNTASDLEIFLNQNIPNSQKAFTANPRSQQICKKDESGLSKTMGAVINHTIKNQEEQAQKNASSSGLPGPLDGSESDITPTGYSKKDDNKVFPCSDYFCIKPTYENFNFNQGPWVNEDPSIEYLLKRGNEHLKKFTATSMIQAKMTINNFELGLKDFTLPEIFHLDVETTKRAVPMLDLTYFNENKDRPIYNTENTLKQYYSAYGLDYDKPNDLSILKTSQGTRSATDGAVGAGSSKNPSGEYGKNSQFYQRYEKLNTLRNQVDEKVKAEIQQDYEQKATEITSFADVINDQINRLDAILNNMLEIPIDPTVS